MPSVKERKKTGNPREGWVEESETASGRERVWVCPEEGIDRLRPGRFGMVTWQSDYSWRNGVILHA